MYRVILWDVDGTLLDFLAAERCAMKECFRRLAMGECTDEMIVRYSAINQSYWRRLERGEITKGEVLVGRYRQFFSEQGLDITKAEAFNEEYQVRLGDTIVFCDDSKEIVRSLKNRKKQYVVSNGTIRAQTRKLKNSGFDELMDGIFLSEQVGYEKPAKAFFDAVFHTLQDVRPEEMLIVGDSLTSDIRGGNNAGIATCWYNPSGLINDQGVNVDYEIRDLHEIIAL